MIRSAVLSDRMRVLTMAKAFHAASEVLFPFSAPMADNVFCSSLDAPDRLCLVLDLDGVAHGVLAAEAQPHRFSLVKMAFEIMFWIDPAHRGRHAGKMIEAYEQWARQNDCAFIHMVGLGGDPLTARLYERSGYVAVERHFMKPL